MARAQCRTKPQSLERTFRHTAVGRDPTALSLQRCACRSNRRTPPGASHPTSAVAQDASTIARKLRMSAGRKISALFDLRDWATYVYLPIAILLFIVLPLKGSGLR